MINYIKLNLEKLRKIPIFGWLIEQIFANFAVLLTLTYIATFWTVTKPILQNISNLSVAIEYYLITHPTRAAIAITMVALFILYTATITTFTIKLSQNTKTCIRQESLLNNVGITSFFVCDSEEKKKLSWSFFINDIESKSPQHIEILAVTGKYTFGDKEAPLRDFLKSFDGEIRILLIDPFCPALTQRASGVSGDKNAERRYRKNIFESINFCKSLHQKGKHITVKIYKQKPIWKMIYTDSSLWLQYYNPGKSIEDSQIYTFFPNQEKTSMYYPITDVFQKRWHHDNNQTADLSAKQTYREYLREKLLPTI